MQQVKIIWDEGVERAFLVRIVLPGERYGLDDCLIYSAEDHPRHANDPLVEFYDFKNPSKFPPRGQFVGRYYLSTLLERTPEHCMHGLDLCGYEPAWKITGKTFCAAIVFVLETIPWQAISDSISEAISEALSDSKSGLR